MDIPTKKSLGQHWLTDHVSLEAMVDCSGIMPNDFVLEIGPGPGALTGLLVDAAGTVVAVEFDHALAEMLPKRVPAKNLRVVEQDILSFDLTQLPPDYKVAANIPYYLTSHLVRILSETSNPPLQMALLVQKEVAERLAARPGGMSLLSVTAQFYNDVSLGPVVSKDKFAPPPKVDSQIVVLKRRSRPLFPEITDTKAFFRVVKSGFSQRRKTLLNSLAGGLQLSKPEVMALLNNAGIDGSLRPQALSLEQWHSLYSTFTI